MPEKDNVIETATSDPGENENTPKEVEIVIWCPESYRVLFDYITEAYNGMADPYVEVTVEYFPSSDDLHKNILMDSDLSRLPNIVVTDYIRECLRMFPDLSMPLDEYVDKDIFISQAAVSNCCIQGILRGFPIASYIAAFYYNRKDFAETLGTDLLEYISKENFIEYAENIKDQIGKYIISYYDDLARVLLLADGNLEFDENGKIVGDSVRELFEFFEELKNRDVIYYAGGDEYDANILVNGPVCGVIGGYYWCQNIKNILEEQGSDQHWSVTNVPYGAGACSLADMGCIVIAKEKEEKLQTIVDFLTWAFVSNEQVAGMLVFNGVTPVTHVPEGFYDNYNDDYFGNVIKFLANLLKDIPAIEYGPYEQQAMRLVEILSKKIVTGEMSVDEAYNVFDGYDFENDDYVGGWQPDIDDLEYIEVLEHPEKKMYWQYEAFSKAGMVVVGHYRSGEEKEIIGYRCEPTFFEYTGKQVVTVIYMRGTRELTTTLEVEVKPRKLISISAEPFNYYLQGNELTNKDFYVVANYDQGPSRQVTDFTIVGDHLLANSGEQEISILYLEGPYSASCEVEINVYKRLERIKIESLPKKLMYYDRDMLDITGMTVTATYWDNSEKTISNGRLKMSPGIVKFQNGKTYTDITISYTEFIITKTATLRVYKKTGEELDDCNITQDFGSCGTGTVNMSSGRLKYKFTDFACSDETFPITISRVYDIDAGDYGVGKGWRLNLQQELKLEDEHWKYIDKNGKDHIFDNGYSTEGGRSEIRNKTLGFDLFNYGDKIWLVDRSNNTLVFSIIKGVYRLVAIHKYPSKPDSPIGAYTMNIEYDSTTGYISSVAAGREIDWKRRNIQFVYTNGLLTSLKYSFASSTVVAEYVYEGNSLKSIKKCNRNVINSYSATTNFARTESGFIVEDMSSNDDAGNYKRLIYTIETGSGMIEDGKVSAISVGYGETDRETTTINYTGTIKSTNQDNPETDIVASCYTENNGTLSVTSFNSLCAASSYSYEKGDSVNGTYLNPKKVNSALSRGFDYKALADSYSNNLDVFHDDFENKSHCGWSGGGITRDKYICGTASLKCNADALSKSYTFNTDKADGQTLYLSLWAMSSAKITITVKIEGARGFGEFTHVLDSGLVNLWQFTAFCLGRVYDGETITIDVDGNGVCIDDVRLTKAPYETPDDIPQPEYNAFGNIEKEYTYSPVDGKVACTEYKYNSDHQLSEKTVTIGDAPHSKEVYEYEKGLLVGTKVYGTGINYFEETYTYTNNVQTKTTDVNGVITECSYGIDWTQSVAWSNETKCPSVAVKNTYYTNSNAIEQVSSGEYVNELNYNADGSLQSAQYGSQSSDSQSQISFEYDTFGNMNKAIIDTVLVKLEYDYKHLKNVTYANGGYIEYFYDDKNRITKIKESGGYSADITYSDNAEDTVTVIDTTVQYQSRTINTGGKTSEYSVYFDEGSLILKVVGLALNGAGNISTTEFYTDNSSTPFERITTVADRNGQLTELKREEHGASSTYEYDDLYRLKSKKTTKSSKTFKIEYEYEDGTAANRAYSRLSSEQLRINTTNKDKFSYEYYSNGNIAKILLNGKTYAEYVYDQYGRLIQEYDPIFGEINKYEYDANGNILSKSIYDKTGKVLISMFSYDYSSIADGCRQNEAWGDQLKKYDNNDIKYDKYGNPTEYLGIQLTWSGRKLVKIDNTAMKYDYNGLRVKKGNRRYYWQGNNLKMEQDDTLNQLIYYYYDESGVCGMNYNGADYYFQKNMLGDVCAIYNSSGVLQCRYVYDAWGNHKLYDSYGNEIEDNGNLIGSINPFRYRGYYWDKEFGLYYLKSRYYYPVTGRFISPDGIKYLKPNKIGGMNLYAYCDNNPVMYTDPDGQIAGLLIGVLLFLGAATVIGGVVGGVESYKAGNRGWDVVWDVLLGAGLGLGIGGAIVTLIGVGLISFGVTTIAGCLVAKAVIIGIAAYNVIPILIAPFMGIDDATVIEYESNPYSPPEPPPTPPISYI